jgi:hypothetical protein
VNCYPNAQMTQKNKGFNAKTLNGALSLCNPSDHFSTSYMVSGVSGWR